MFDLSSAFDLLDKVGSKALSDEEMAELSSIIFEMGDIYGSTQICMEGASEECYYLG